MANDLDIEKFIEAVRSRTPLWDKLDPMHRNLDLTNGLWLSIVDEMGGHLTVPELKQKWHNLRDCFRREIRTAQAGKKKRRWIYYNKMLFLLSPHYINKNVRRNNFKGIVVQDGVFPVKAEAPDEIIPLELNNTDSNDSDFTETENINKVNVGESLQHDFSEETYQGEVEKNEQVRSVFGKAGEQCGYWRVSTENENLQNRNRRVALYTSHFRPTANNDDYHFAMSIIPYMRQVALNRKLKMRIRISEVIAQECGYCEDASSIQS